MDFFYACYTEKIRKVFESQYGFSCKGTLYPWSPWDSDWDVPEKDLENRKEH